MDGAVDRFAGLFIEPKGGDDLAHPSFGGFLRFFKETVPSDAEFLELVLGVRGDGFGIFVAKDGEEDGVPCAGDRAGGVGGALFGDDSDPIRFRFAGIAVGPFSLGGCLHRREESEEGDEGEGFHGVSKVAGNGVRRKWGTGELSALHTAV